MRPIANLKGVLRLLLPLLALQLMSCTRPASGDPVSVINDLNKAFTETAATAMDAVALIETAGTGRGGSGSGFVIRSDGVIATNAHVLEDAEKIEVTLPSGQGYKAKLVGIDRDTDVAVVKIEASGLPFLTWGDSSKLRVGEIVFALGNPLGLNWSATFGIVSATGRTDESGVFSLSDFIQTNALINPGNSGGPLVNIRGEVVGITNMHRVGTGIAGISFAVPANSAKQVVNELLKHGRMDRGYLGIDGFKDLTKMLAMAFDRPNTKGVFVTSVVRGGPADKAGIKAGDIILACDGKPVEHSARFKVFLGQAKPKANIKLTIFRKGETLEANATFAEQSVKGTARFQPIGGE